VARAIEAGDTETGTTIMQMEAGLDTGPMLLAEPLAIDPADTTVTLTAKLAAQGAGLIVAALRAAAAGELCATPQPEAGVTYAHKLAREEAWLDWTQPAARLVYQVRAFQPFPVACTRLRETDIKLHAARAEAAEPGAEPGMVLGADAGGVRISCGDGVLVATELQRAGGRRLPAREFLAGLPLMVGDRCSAPVRAPA
jgi:methionyl-tRNA formyltransferase